MAVEREDFEAAVQEWFTIHEAARHLRISRRTVYQLLARGELVSYRVGGAGHRRFKREDLERVMRKDEGKELYSMDAMADPVLAELWDNDTDAQYDTV